MNNKIEKAITEMKNQTIGVEVEFNGINREKAAEVVSMCLNGSIYTKHYEGGCYRAWSITAPDGRVWKIMRDSSIHGVDDERCELVTPILHYSDIETLQEIIRALRKAGAKSSPSRGCGVHIHIGLGGHNAKTLRNLTNIMAAHEAQLAEAIRVSYDRINSYCSMISPTFLAKVNARKPETMGELKSIWYGGHDGSWQHYHYSRYHMLNLHSVFSKGTIEFRLFQFAEPHNGKQGGLHAGELKAYIQLCLAMSQRALMVRSASPKAQQTENNKYAMRCWMLQLGFIGDEFKTAREVLLRNMSGDGAWRHGRPENVA